MTDEERQDLFSEEEKFDEWDAGIYPDEEKAKAIALETDESPFDIEKDTLLEYYRLFESLLRSVGKVAYYWKTRNNVHAGVPAVDEVAAKYGHRVGYYNFKLHEWIDKSNECLDDLVKFNYKNIKIPYKKKDFLKSLVSEDRRRCYYETIGRGKKKEIFFSYEDFEERYQKRLKNRKEKEQKKK